MSFSRLIDRIVKLQNPTVAGLDPRLEYIPNHILERNFEEYGRDLNGAAHAVLEFNKGLIDALCDIVPAVKPQAAYYELLGWRGMKTLYKTIRYAQKRGMYVITDGKRNDIGSTMEAYSAAHLGTTLVDGQEFEAFGADALTVNGYLGSDGIKPLLKDCVGRDKGIFVLCKTSNPSSGELQDRQIADDRSVYRTMGSFCEQWGENTTDAYGYSAVGAVVGATYPQQLAELRAALPHTFFLVPGYGAQGGGAKGVAPAFDAKGLGAIVNSSRAIMCAWKSEDGQGEQFAQAARKEALRMREDLMQFLPKLGE